MDSDKNYIGNQSAIKTHYGKWKTIEGHSPEKDTELKRLRGYELEKLLYSIFFNEQLKPATGYKPTGEQVDGNFWYQHLPFLFEAKWHKDPIEASQLYSFKGKVDGKFHLTSGIFISMSGFSKDAPDALRIGKTSNVLLFDGEDMDQVFIGKKTFTEILTYKIEKAAFYGELYMPISSKDRIQKQQTFTKKVKSSKQKDQPQPKPSRKSFRLKVLIVSPDQKLLRYVVDSHVENIVNRGFEVTWMTVVGNADLSNIQRTLFNIPNFMEYSGIILLYPNIKVFQYERSELNELNELLTKTGFKNGVLAVLFNKPYEDHVSFEQLLDSYLTSIFRTNTITGIIG